MQPTNPLVTPMLTDLYQLTMAYGYWKASRHKEQAVFDLFFRKNPFGGEFTLFAGLQEVIKFVSNFQFTDDQIAYLKKVMPDCEDAFFKWLRGVDCSSIKLYAIKEGSVIFPRIPLIRVEGQLAIAQILETALLNLINYPTLVATNAARFRLAAGQGKSLLEFGLRRAQGPDGGVSASRYSYLGGFDATSNVLAGQLYGIPVRGTMAHSFVSSFADLGDLKKRTILGPNDLEHDLISLTFQWREKLGFTNTNESELTAFIAYAQAFPKEFLALVDTYNTLHSGIPNFLCVAFALKDIGYQPLGIRLDSGDLAYLSKEARKMFQQISQKFPVDLADLKIAASNDINEEILYSLNQQGHEIDVFGIGTHLVTCQAQPALGCVYKLVEINGRPCIKLSEDKGKTIIPGRKKTYRLIGEDGSPILDLLTLVEEDPPQEGRPIICRHPFEETKKVSVIPTRVEALHECVWEGSAKYFFPQITLDETRKHALKQLRVTRSDHLRAVNPTPYKVSVSEKLYNFLHQHLEQVGISTLQ